MDNTLDILAHASEAVFAVNDEKRVVYWNAAAEALLGIPADKANGQLCWKLIEGKTPAGQRFCGPECPIQAQIEAQTPVPPFDLWLKAKSGKSILTHFSTITIAAQNGRQQPNQPAIIHFMQIDNHRETPYSGLRVNLLGPLEVWRTDGTPVNGKSWRRAKVRGLFVFLLLRRGQSATREELAAALWPEHEYSAALRNLNTTVYNLRRSLEPGLKSGDDSLYLFHEAGHYWLGGSQTCWLDTEAFELGIQQARLETAVDKAIHRYQEALALYRGDYLIDLLLPGGINVRIEQARLRQLFLDALEELGNLYLQQEQTEQARSTYLKILAIDPARESTFRLLAQISHKTGSWQDSVAYCQRLATALKNELDLISSQDLTNPCDPKKQKDS